MINMVTIVMMTPMNQNKIKIKLIFDFHWDFPDDGTEKYWCLLSLLVFNWLSYENQVSFSWRFYSYKYQIGMLRKLQIIYKSALMDVT